VYESYYCGQCTYLNVFERIDAITGVELAIAVHQLEELDVFRRLVLEFRHRLVEDGLHGSETVCTIFVVLCAVGQARYR
jgi:hypothetical protein